VDSVASRKPGIALSELKVDQMPSLADRTGDRSAFMYLAMSGLSPHEDHAATPLPLDASPEHVNMSPSAVDVIPASADTTDILRDASDQDEISH
jgi:hypothetical protein